MFKVDAMEINQLTLFLTHKISASPVGAETVRQQQRLEIKGICAVIRVAAPRDPAATPPAWPPHEHRCRTATMYQTFRFIKRLSHYRKC